MAEASASFPDRYRGKFPHMLVSSPAPFVAHVEIARPAALNAFTPAMWLAFGRVFDLLSTDPDVRAVVLSGAGDRAFTAGLDLAWAAGVSAGSSVGEDVARVAARLRRHVEEFQESIGRMERCEKPVICVLHGICFGLAIDIACCADIRICSHDATLSVKEVDLGIVADIGTLSRLPKVVGNHSWVKDVCLTARHFSAQEALTYGFVNYVLPDKAGAMSHAVSLASVLAGKSPVAVQGTKEILNHGRDHSVADSLKYTALWNASVLQSDDFKTALDAVKSKRLPVFAKL